MFLMPEMWACNISWIKNLYLYIGMMMTPIEGRNMLPEVPYY
jgi:hypothetical protein